MNKGLIMEIKGREVIVLTPEGVFRSVKRMNLQWQVGEEIDLTEAEAAFSRKTRRFFPALAIAATILLTFATVFAFSLTRTGTEIGVTSQEIAYVSLDINPSIEMSINQSFEVLQINGMNEEGKQVVQQLNNWSNQPVDQVALQIIELAKQNGYLDENRDVLISTAFLDDNSATQYEAALEQELTNIQTSITQSNQKSAPSQEKEQIQVHYMKLEAEIKIQAKEKGISPGKYSIYLEAKEQGFELELEDLSKQSISSIAQQLGGLGPIVSNINSKHHRVEAGYEDNKSTKDKNKENKKDNSKDSEKEKADERLKEKEQESDKGKDKSKEKGKDKDKDKGSKESPAGIIDNVKKGTLPSQSGKEKGSMDPPVITTPINLNQLPLPTHVKDRFNTTDEDDEDEDDESDKKKINDQGKILKDKENSKNKNKDKEKDNQSNGKSAGNEKKSKEHGK